LPRPDLDEFVECFRPGKRHLRKLTWAEQNRDGRCRAFEYGEIIKRDRMDRAVAAESTAFGAGLPRTRTPSD
jgi:hypothetical protein